MKVAIFRKVMDGAFTFDSILRDDEATPDSIYAREYTQMTEWAEVNFVHFPPAVTVGSQIKQIDAAESELRNKFAQKLSDLNESRARLLSLSHETQS